MVKQRSIPEIDQETNPKWISEKLDLLAPDSIPPVQQAYARLDSRIQENENTLWQKVLDSNYRTAWVTLVIVAILVVSLSFPQVRGIANSFLGLFRVEQIEAVSVGFSLDDLPAEMETQFMTLKPLFADQIIVDQEINPIPVTDITDASQRVGFQARVPTQPDGEMVILVQNGSTIRLAIDRARWQAIIDSMGYPDFKLPADTDGKEIILNIPEAVVIGIGDCEYTQTQEIKLATPNSTDCTIFLQSRTPTIEAPPGVDINRAGQILLQILGLSESEAKSFSATVNWATTLVVPVPSDIEYQHVSIEGVDGIFLNDSLEGGKTVYTLLWVKNDLLHALIGDGSLTDALQSVKSLE